MSTTMSLEVNTVRKETNPYMPINNFFPLLPVRPISTAASRRKKPSSSRYTDKNVRQRNSARIFNGFISPEAVNPSHVSSAVKVPERSKKMLPHRAGSQ